MNNSFTMPPYAVKDHVSELTVRNASRHESGTVAVVVRNAAGEAGSQGFLLVQGAGDFYELLARKSSRFLRESTVSNIVHFMRN